MNTADIFFQAYSNFVLDILIILMWGWGVIYTLSKITKYKKMLLGAFGCLGMFALHIYEGISNAPDALIVVMPNFENVIEMKSNIINTWQSTGIANYELSLVLLFQICIVSAIAGRFKMEDRLDENKEVATDSVVSVVDNDLDHSNDSNDTNRSYESEEIISEADDSQEYVSEEMTSDDYASEEYVSEEYVSEEMTSSDYVSEEVVSADYHEESQEKEYIEAYTESEADQQGIAEDYVAIEAYSDSQSTIAAEEVDESFFEEEDDPLAIDEERAIPETKITSAPELEVDDLTDQGYDSEVARAQTITSDNDISIPLEPSTQRDFTMSSHISEFTDSSVSIPNEPNIDDDVEQTLACDMEELVKEAESSPIAIPAEPDLYDDVEATISCDMKEIVQDPSFDDDTFAGLGDEDFEEEEEEDSTGNEDNRSLLRNLLPPGSSNKRKS
ncbi:hypothetical protein [Candidatus Uabimicrobium sp. HlEnr_7]|uniref:hypothetical protein n=1 Tax=Candidatus Uabimicrobium helgolandensis TaxID=3095367 RepID=UPI003556ED0C